MAIFNLLTVLTHELIQKHAHELLASLCHSSPRIRVHERLEFEQLFMKMPNAGLRVPGTGGIKRLPQGGSVLDRSHNANRSESVQTIGVLHNLTLE